MTRTDPMLALGEETMIEAWRLLLRLPDREKGWLASGSRRSLPAPLRENLGWIDAELALKLGLTMPEPPPEPRTQLGPREMAKLHRAWFAPLCLAEAVPSPHRRLTMAVIAAKAGRMPGGFRWEDVGAALYGKRWGTARCDATSDALRMRYEAAMRCVAIRIAVWEAFGGEAGGAHGGAITRASGA